MQKKTAGSSQALVILGIVLLGLFVVVFGSKIPELGLLFPHASTTTTGTLYKIVNIGAKSTSQESFVKLTGGSKVTVSNDSVKDISSGSVISFTQPTSLLVARTTSGEISLAAPQGVTVVTAAKAALPATGNKKVAVVLVDFNNLGFVSGNSPTIATATSTMNSIKSFFSENSFGRMTFVGGAGSNVDVIGRYHLPISASCNLYSTTDSTLSYVNSGAATGLPKIDLSTYDYIIISYAAQSGGNILCTSVAATQGPYNPGVKYGVVTVPDQLFNINGAGYGLITQGLGYNLGGGAACIGPVDSSCNQTWPSVPDYNDAMSGAVYHFNGFVKNMVGWLLPSNVITVVSTGDYQISPIELTTTVPQILKVKRQTYPSGFTGWFYVETKANTLADSTIPSGYIGGALIHWTLIPPSPQPVFQPTILVDAHGVSSTYVGPQFNLNQEFSDSSSGVSIKPISRNGNVLTVHVVVPGGTTTPSPTPTPPPPPPPVFTGAITFTLVTPPAFPLGFTKNQPVVFNYKLTEPDGTAGTPQEGFNVQAYVDNAVTSVVGVNGAFDSTTNLWKVSFNMPPTAGSYKYYATGYCSRWPSATYSCGYKYTKYQQVQAPPAAAIITVQ